MPPFSKLSKACSIFGSCRPSGGRQQHTLCLCVCVCAPVLQGIQKENPEVNNSISKKGESSGQQLGKFKFIATHRGFTMFRSAFEQVSLGKHKLTIGVLHKIKAPPSASGALKKAFLSPYHGGSPNSIYLVVLAGFLRLAPTKNRRAQVNLRENPHWLQVPDTVTFWFEPKSCCNLASVALHRYGTSA